ncbi:M23 family metallopeptidase [Flavimarina sp. Hel_I_48]|uniref:M23 family metallopeptidase n=1 Tax=Flavimarina sp. Hel_I_48 TaxID=1392488 RepID=UPI00068B51A5|nr:M23 family metallopeptidase [Flavimarina sp. Hel_I_48]
MLTFLACKEITKAKDFITNPSAREVYKRELENDSTQSDRWERAFELAKKDSVLVKLPYVESGHFWQNNFTAAGYNLHLQQGERFSAEIQADSVKNKVFLALFRSVGDSLNPLKLELENLPNENQIQFTVKETGDYKLVVQPEIQASTTFNLLLYRTPLYSFPVAEKGNAAIQSFWGANRDGGRRSHEGLDIFADRGTPVLAACDGRVSSTGNRGLGGKQVWLRSGIFGNSLYYAHLDSIIASPGQRVKRGDTLGLVGNTGNARTTPPHLHFGIYRRGRGAINPLPYVFEGIAPVPSAKNETTKQFCVVTSSIANIRASAFAKAEKLGQAKRDDTLKILGKTTDWYHIRTRQDQSAYIHQSLLRDLTN